MTPENKVKKKIKDWMKKKGIFNVSIAAGRYSTVGISDRLACVDGRFVAIEIKASDNSKPTPLQQIFIDNVIEAGGVGFVTYSVEHMEKMFNQFGLKIPEDEPELTIKRKRK